MKKPSLLLLVGLAVILIGGSLVLIQISQRQKQQNQNQNQNTNASVNGNLPVADQNPSVAQDQNNNQTTTDDTTDWQTYTNSQYGFSFKYPSDWPEPVFVNDSGQLPDGSRWRIGVGDVNDICEGGGSCHSYYFYDISNKDYNAVLSDLKENKTAITNIVEKNVNGSRVIEYYELGMGETLVAAIFGGNQRISFTSISNNAKTFDSILSTFKFTK